MKTAHIGFLLLTLAGCGLKQSMQPIPDYFHLWKKPGASLLDVRKSLLECGWPTASPSGYGPDVAMMSPNDKVLADLCMENDGYRYTSPFHGYQVINACALFSNRQDYPACQPGAVIPKPTVERRLNSWHCKLELDYDYCLKHAVRPSLCRPDDFMHPPPECRP